MILFYIAGIIWAYNGMPYIALLFYILGFLSSTSSDTAKD